MKAILYDIADEVYLVAPLGKILKGGKNDSVQNVVSNFNSDLKFKNDDSDTSKTEYLLTDRNLLLNDNIVSKLKTKDKDEFWYRKTILVTTQRIKGRHNFYSHYEHIRDIIKKNDFDPSHTKLPADDPSGSYLWTCEFDELPNVTQEQNEVEIPHENLRPFRTKYFWVEE
jgi:hypothetical protein